MQTGLSALYHFDLYILCRYLKRMDQEIKHVLITSSCLLKLQRQRSCILRDVKIKSVLQAG